MPDWLSAHNVIYWESSKRAQRQKDISDETPDMSQPGYYYMIVDTPEMSADNYEIIGSSCLLDAVESLHTFTDLTLGTVLSEHDSIFASRSKGCEEYGDPSAVLTLSGADRRRDL